MASRRTRIKGLVANIPQRRKATALKEEPITDSIKTEINKTNEINLESTENLQREALCNNSLSTSSAKIVEKVNDTEAAQNKDSLSIVNSEIIKTESEKILIKNVKIVDHIIIPPNEIQENLDISSTNQECEITLNEVNLTGDRQADTFATDKSTSQDNKGNKQLVSDTSSRIYTDKEYPPPPPSPSKFNRSRIKAIPRFSQRKTSFSASESEDETKKYSRIRNDSVSSVTGWNGSDISEVMSPQQKPVKDNAKMVQKKINKSENYRKLAEARREYHKRFGSKNPEKQHLKMIDLIFYNPTTNPMSKKEPKELNEENNEKSEIVEDDPEETKQDEIEVIKSKEQVTEKESDEENEMPVPQIKIGPTGEIILDEQSLVIERKEIAQAKEDIQKSALVDGDFDTGYGIYKRAKRSKDWNQQETLRFYKALNVIGTDFTSMCELFPKRTRRELKLKFKKEERLNQYLIDKAVMEPCLFNYTELKLEVELQEKEMAEIQKIKEEEALKNKEKKAESAAAKKKKFQLKKEQLEKEERKRNIDKKEKEDRERIRDNKNKEEREKIKDESKQRHTTPYDGDIPLKVRKLDNIKLPKAFKVQKPKVLSINSVLPNSDADESDQNSSESEGEIIVPPKQTRSGRVPRTTLKVKEVETTERVATISKIMRKNRSISNCSNTSVDNLVPGSIMIIPEDESSDKTTYKMYMVTPDKNLIPLEVDSDTVSKAVRYKENENNVGENMVAYVEDQEKITAKDKKDENVDKDEITLIDKSEENIDMEEIIVPDKTEKHLNPEEISVIDNKEENVHKAANTAINKKEENAGNSPTENYE